MDEEGMLIDIADVRGVATAAICVQVAIVAMLVRESRLTIAQAAELTGVADTLLASWPNLPPDALALGRHALAGFAASLLREITRH